MSVINVNLRPCQHHELMPVDSRGRHRLASGNFLVCDAGAPINIPCPIPRSVEFAVRLGECDCNADAAHARSGLPAEHLPSCPARPIRVTCSIAGETWARSEVVDADYPETRDKRPDADAIGACVLRQMRMRWGIVKLLVTGQHPGLDDSRAGMTPNLFIQRDAVFAALADMARAESTLIQRFADLDKVYTNRTRAPFRSIVADELAAYVKHLISQVGTL